jgi:hypothetical protein
MRKSMASAVLVLLSCFSGAAWAQQDDLDVTMKVVPADATGAGAITVIKLPDAASDRARDASAAGLSTANTARDMKGDLGRDFGQSVSEAARAKGHIPTPGAGKGKAP